MNNLLYNDIFGSKKSFKIILAIILLFGVAIRLFHYLYNRSLWMDEVYLCSGLSYMGYVDLATKTLDYNQKAPIGFLWMVKLTINLFGNNEMALRIVPLVSGIISLLLFTVLCKYFLKRWGQLIAVSIFCFAPALIYHSVEIKQYATECLATLIAIYLFIIYQDKKEWSNRLIWGIFGAIIVWFSFSVIFILTGIAVGVNTNYLIKKNWTALFNNILPFSLWFVSFLSNYFFFTHKHADTEWVTYFFKVYDNFMPFPPLSIQQFTWFPRNFIDMLDYPLGLVWNLKDAINISFVRIITIPLIPAILLFTGTYSLFNFHRKYFYVLIFPIILTLLASGAHMYPLVERFWVFLSPIFILLLTLGFEYLEERIRSRKILFFLILMVIISPIVQSLYSVTVPQKFYRHKKSYERESLVYINNNFKEGDAVYNYWNNAPGYKVYKNIYNFKYHAIEGLDLRKKSKNQEDYNINLQIDFIKFSNKKRVWIIFNNQFLTDIGDKIDDPKWYYKNKFPSNENLILQVKRIGKPIFKTIRNDVTVYLFELRPANYRSPKDIK